MNKENLKQLKEWVDITIDFLKLVSKYLGNAVAAILAHLPGTGRNGNGKYW